MGLLRHSFAALTAVILFPMLGLALLFRPALRVSIRDRLGYRDPGHLGRIQVHASSVGEAKAATRLIRQLESRGYALRATTSTSSGRSVFERELPHIPISLAPLDHPWLVDRALRATQPRLSILVETELWPSRIAAAARRGIPVVVVSGRLSDRSFPRYRRIRSFVRPTLRRIAAVGARSDVDAARFVELGAREDRVQVTGDLKLDPPVEQPSLAIDLIRALADDPVVVGGSTHRGEEDALLAAQAAAEKEGHGFVLVLAPRHVERAREVVALARRRGRRVHLRSELEGRHLVPGEVLVLDRLGELSALYATASVAFVGGTLAPIGGHNLVEPVHAGCPVLFGPHLANVRKIVEILEVGEAGRRVEDAEHLARALIECFDDLEACRVRGELGRETLEAHRGSVERTCDLIEGVLAEHSSTTPRSDEGRVIPAREGVEASSESSSVERVE